MRDDWWYASPAEGIEAAPRAEPEDPLDAAPLALKATDGETLCTRYGIVKQSTTIAGMAAAQGESPALNQPIEVQLDAKMLRSVITWCDFHRGEPPLKLEMHPIRRRYECLDLSAEERRYFDDQLLVLWELAAAADYLHVSRLYYAICMMLYSNAKSHCLKTRRLIQAMGLKTLGKEIKATCHAVPRNVSVSVYCDVLRFDEDEEEERYEFVRDYGGYLLKIADVHSSVLPRQLYQAHVEALSDDEIFRMKGSPEFAKCVEYRVLINVQKYNYYGDYVRDIVVDEVEHLSKFALTDVNVRKIDDDHVLASLRRLLSSSTAVACETLDVQGFSPEEHRFLQQIALVGELLQTIRHVEEFKMEMSARQLIAFLPKAVDVKFPSHVSLHIEVMDDDEVEIANYGAHQWMQLLRALDQMHENAIQLRLRCIFGPYMLRALYQDYLNSKIPVGVELLMDLEEWGDDVKPVVAALGLQLADKRRSGELFYQSTERRDIPPGQVRVENLDTGDTIYVPWQTKGGKKAAPSGKRSGGRHKRLTFDPTGLSVDAEDGQNVDIAYESGKGGWEVAGVGAY